MNISDKIFQPETYSYEDYKLWEGNWELIYGYPQAMSPSPKRAHQEYSGNFFAEAKAALKNLHDNCNCKVFYELDWIINDNTVVRPDLMITCGDFNDDFLLSAPILVLEITSRATAMRDRNTKYKLYEMSGVKYYLIADTEKKSVEIFQLIDNKYKQVETSDFYLTPSCNIHIDVNALWI